MHPKAILVVIVTAACLAASVDEAFAQSAQALYTRALERERVLRDSSNRPSLAQIRAAVTAYEQIVHRYPKSGYCDNALWQAANLSLLAHDQFAQTADRLRALKLLALLRSQYPASSLLPRAVALAREREAVAPVRPAPTMPDPVAITPAPASAPANPVLIRSVKRTELPGGVRVTLELEAEVPFHSERVENPSRVFFDLKGARPSASLNDSTLKYDDGLVREVRIGRHPGATRVVMDMEGADGYSVFTLYDPYRLIVDVTRSATNSAVLQPAAPIAVPVADTAALPAGPPSPVVTPKPSPAEKVDSPAAAEAVPTTRRDAATSATPSAPSANSDGKFSLSRQLGLGVSRIVIDAGHGGHDPGARANGLSEAELTLDVAVRLKRLLEQEPGVDVVMTRSTDVFVPLEERTRIANREGADLFLSIHANASRNTKARGIETYFLNFALTPDAEAVAARENAGSSQTMHKLPEIVRAITLNNKINESRDFASMVQRAMVKRLSAHNRQVRDIGVKQAPFVVLIGAGMPSVLAEISFVTNKADAALLKTGSYRQHIAQALLDGVLRYQQSLKRGRSASTADVRQVR